MYSHPANSNITRPPTVATPASGAGLLPYAVDPHNPARRAYAQPQAHGQLLKPLRIPPLTVTDTYTAATWFTNTLLPAVNVEYTSEQSSYSV